MRKRAARWLRRLADRIDHAGAPKIMHWSFTFEEGEGIVFRDDGRGCPLAYLGDRDYKRAHDESGPLAGDPVPTPTSPALWMRTTWDSRVPEGEWRQ
jgi:hypothetical protein